MTSGGNEPLTTIERLSAQGLSGEPLGSPDDVVGRLLAVQAQDARGARLTIRSRTNGLSAADVDSALELQVALSASRIRAMQDEVRELARARNAVILAHNHPSGNIEPSESDKQLTKNIIKAAVAMELRIFDHVIIGENSYFSFADEGLI